MDYGQVWSYRIHEGITCEVVKRQLSSNVCWNTYLYIFDKAMVDKLWSDDKHVYEWGMIIEPKSIIENLDWHGGQTYYHQVTDNEHRYIKVGDDYQHVWDEGREYNEVVLMANIKEIANDLMTKMEQA